MNAESSSNPVRNRRVFRFLSYLLVFLMLAGAVMTVGSFIRSVVPEWHSDVIVGILLFIVIDRLYTYRHLKSLTLLSTEWAIALAAQWVLILLLTRFLLSYANGIEALRADLSLFGRGVLGDLFTPEYVVTLLLAILFWALPAQFLALLDEIGLDEELALREEAPPLQDETVLPAHQRLVSLLFSLGIGLVIVTMLTRINVRTILANVSGLPDVQISRFSGAEGGVLLYFVFGLTLLSLSRLMSLQTHWNRLRIPVASSNLTRQWGIYSLVFLAALAILVSLLPAGDSFGLLSVLGTLFSFLLGVLFFIGQVLISLILLLISLPFLLMGRGAPLLNEMPPPPPLPSLPVEPVVPPPGSEIWLLVRSILLWAGLILLLVFALIRVIRQHDAILPALRRSRVASWLLLAWQWISRSAGNTRAAVGRALADGWQTLVARLERNRILPAAGLLRLRSLAPRQRIHFFYLAMIRRGAEQGLDRKPSQTPAEYAATLERALPSAQEDIEGMTQSFIEARYSRQDIELSRAESVRAMWGRIRRAFQTRSRRQRSGDQS